MIFIMETGAHSDDGIDAILEGPDEADFDAILRSWVDNLSEEEVIAGEITVTMFVLWLSQQEGWREVDHRVHNVGSYNDELYLVEARRDALRPRATSGPGWGIMRVENQR